jgi:polyvinyl alcohol dehydrogenase (cytochrome)
MAGLPAQLVPRLTLKWAFGFPGASQAFAQPAVAGGRVFVGSAPGTVYSLDADTGCQYWAFTAEGPVRTAMSLGRLDSDSGRWVVYFGDRLSNVYAVDAVTGTLVWKRRVGDHLAATITGAPTLAGGMLYVGTSSFEEALGASAQYPCCTFRGSVSALDAATGDLRWRSHVIQEELRPVRRNKAGVQLQGPSGAAIWSAPTVDVARGAVYVTTGDSYSDPAASTSDAFVAFDLETGALLWSRQTTAGDAYTVDCDFPEAAQTNCPEADGPDFDFGSSAMLVELAGGRRALVAGQKSGVVHAVDPDRDGAVLWQTRVGAGGRLGGVQWGSAYDGERVYVALSDVVMEAPGPGGEGAQPTFQGAPMRLNASAGGGLFALAPRTGEVVWQTPHPGCADRPGCSPAQSAAVTAIPGIVFSGGLDGHVRAYRSGDGAIVWDVDTARAYETVNGVEARGGSLDGPGPVVADGTLFVNSGYAFIGGMPGNVLLAFTVDGR